jgi:SAM-dependent methyltransferase
MEPAHAFLYGCVRMGGKRHVGIAGRRVLDLAALLQSLEYKRERLEPRFGDSDYLCLIDLLEAVKSMAPLAASKVLDYGCGGSPYRALFRQAIYHRADLRGGEDLDFAYDIDGRLPAEIGGYDFVLSSQVLEHVSEPDVYLSECRRVLAPGGRLLVTTHGVFVDHACPHDYWRWTAYGLARAVENAGLHVLDRKKLTTGARATLFLMRRNLDIQFAAAGWRGYLLNRALHYVCDMSLEPFNRLVDAASQGCKVVPALGDGEAAGHGLYVGVAVLAEKPK